jgi:carboxymethylenebutenolidase
MQGYVAFAPDALFPLGGYPGNDDDGRAMQKSLDKDKIEQDMVAAALWLKEHEKTTGKLGVVGFCFGGYIANFLAASIPGKVDAAVPFYGTPAKQPLVDQVKGLLLIHFAENDKRVNATWEDYKVVLEKNAAEYEAFTYAKVQHGFHNDSTSRYSPKDAELAWRRTADFFDSHLK